MSKNYMLFYPFKDSEVIWIPKSFITSKDSDVVCYLRRLIRIYERKRDNNKV